MSRRNGSGPKLDLKLNLSPPRVDRRMESPTRSATVSPTSPPSSCVSSEDNNPPTNSASPEATSMALVGCPCCLLYVMVSEEDPKCPQCHNTVLLNFLHEYNNDGTPKNPTNKRSQSLVLCFPCFMLCFRIYEYHILYQLFNSRNLYFNIYLFLLLLLF